MHRSKRSGAKSETDGDFSVHPKLFVFYDKKTGTQRFEVEASNDGRLPIDQAVSLLAMHCIARRQNPRDFCVMIAADEDLVNRLAGRATKLMQSCIESPYSVSLSRRQQEALRGVEENFSNKEIASKLNLSERTVKFHVSALLEKFEVRNRGSLILQGANLHPAGMDSERKPPLQIPSNHNGRLSQALDNERRKQRLPGPLERRSGA